MTSTRTRIAAAALAIAGCGRIGFDAGSGDDVPGPDAAGGPVRVVMTADNGYTLVHRTGATYVAEAPQWNGTSSDIYFGCEEYGLPAATEELFAVAANAGSFYGFYAHVDRGGAISIASSAAISVCDSGVTRTGTSPAPDVAAWLEAALPACTWTPATVISYVITALESCDQVAGPEWIWGPVNNNWLIFRIPVAAP